LVSLVLIVGTCLHVPTSELLLVAPSLALLACVPTRSCLFEQFKKNEISLLGYHSLWLVLVVPIVLDATRCKTYWMCFILKKIVFADSRTATNKRVVVPAATRRVMAFTATVCIDYLASLHFEHSDSSVKACHHVRSLSRHATVLIC
jgi:hypothetical protein